jgi:hypothetical protein
MKSIFTRQFEIGGRYALNTFTQNGTPGLIMIESLIDGFCDYPIVYPKGGIGYDHPERWPKYFKAAIMRWIIKREKTK